MDTHSHAHTGATQNDPVDYCRSKHLFCLNAFPVCSRQDEPVHHGNGERHRQGQERPEGQPGCAAEWCEMHPLCLSRCTHNYPSRSTRLVVPAGTTPICDDIGRHVLNYGRRIPLAEWDARIDVSSRSELPVLFTSAEFCFLL